MPFVNPFPVPIPANFDLNRQSITVPGSAKPGQTPIYVNAAFPHLPGTHTSPDFPKTAYESFNIGLRSNPAALSLGHRPWDATTGDWAKQYEWETYADTDRARTEIGSGLLRLVEEGTIKVARAGWSVGIWAGNRPEWQHVSQAASAYSLILVSLYDTLGPDAVEYCINHSETGVVFASSVHIPALLSLAGNKCGAMKVIVSMDSWASIAARGTRPGVQNEAVLKAWGAEKGVKVMDLVELRASGVQYPSAHNAPVPSTVASYCYTSGTTGNPKAAILTHQALASTVITNLHGSPMASGEVFFSYLPLSHIYERFVEDCCLAAGVSIGYTCGDNLRLLEDMSILKPTIFISVPRVLNRVYQAVKASTVDASGFKGALTRRAFGDKLANLAATGKVDHAFWDRIVFKKVRAVLGGNVKYINSGSAPISPEVLSFLKVAFSATVSEGYGQTENVGTATRCMTGEKDGNGTVGPPQAGVEIKLIDVPDMNYFSTDKPFPRGEMLTRGQMVIGGYLKDEAKSKEAIDAEGWLHSGDIASVDTIGRFKIIDRIKNLVKLSQGEYVALEKVENVYTLCPLLLQCFVYADSLEDHVVAVIVPDPDKFAALASKATGTTISPGDVAAMTKAAADQRCVDAVAATLAPYAEDARLLGYERINKNVHISLVPFTMENDLLTPTFKTKRNIAAQVYANELASLYARAIKKVSKL